MLRPPEPEIPLHKRAYLYLVVAALAWGGNAVAGKLAIGHISPMMLTFWRWSGASGAAPVPFRKVTQITARFASPADDGFRPGWGR